MEFTTELFQDLEIRGLCLIFRHMVYTCLVPVHLNQNSISRKISTFFFAQEPLVVELRSGNTHHVPIASCLPYGCFHKWGYPNSWMVYNGKSQFEMIYMK